MTICTFNCDTHYPTLFMDCGMVSDNRHTITRASWETCVSDSLISRGSSDKSSVTIARVTQDAAERGSHDISRNFVYYQQNVCTLRGYREKICSKTKLLLRKYHVLVVQSLNSNSLILDALKFYDGSILDKKYCEEKLTVFYKNVLKKFQGR